MKRFITLIVIAVAVVACGGNTYTVKGSVSPTDDLKDALAIMQNIFTGEADTAVVIGGKFTFTGEADTTAVNVIQLNAPSARGRYALFVPEKGDIIVDLDSANCVTAGPYTEKLQGLMKEMEDVSDEAAATDSLKEMFKANKTNGIGMFVLSSLIYSLESVSELDELLDGAADFIVNDESVQRQREALKAVENTASGKPFVDIPGTTADGKELKLSDFAGKGKYVIIDFWASWCGPCRREIPNLVLIANEYASKGVQVVGINVWDKEPASVNAVEQLGINYPVIFTHDNSSTENYGVTGIPQIILIGPDGTILERNLRGEGIAAALDKYIK